ncbi:hypothetical protein Ocin01_09486, partial [Orchesella cincta]
CPEGYYGDHCVHFCACASEDYICDPVVGCKLPGAFNEMTNEIFPVQGSSESFQCYRVVGSTESEPRTEQAGQDGSSAGKIVLAVIGLLLFVLIVICIVFYYRRRINKLKQDVHVHYKANPGGIGSDHHHFDNPVYSYQGSSSTHEQNNLSPFDKTTIASNINERRQWNGYRDEDEFSNP